jgi:hypothetical protein
MDRLPEIIEAPEENIVSAEIIELPNEPAKLEEPIEVIPKPILDTKEIFKSHGTSGAQSLGKKDDNSLTVEKVKKPKRQISDKQRENLAKAREKALEKRQANAKLRKEGKLPTKKEQEVIDKKPVVNNIIHETKNITNNFTKEDIETIANNAASKASAKALEDYEMVRKHRKAKKKEAQQITKEKEKIRKTITDATQVQDPFGFCY